MLSTMSNEPASGSAPRLRAHWTLRPTLSQAIRLQLALLLVVLAVSRADGAQRWGAVAVALVLVALSLPLPGDLRHRVTGTSSGHGRRARAFDDHAWVNPVDRRLVGREVRGGSAAGAQQVAVFRQDEGWVALLRVDDLGDDPAVTVLDLVAGIDHARPDEVAVQVVTMLRDLPEPRLLDPSWLWDETPRDEAASAPAPWAAVTLRIDDRTPDGRRRATDDDTALDALRHAAHALRHRARAAGIEITAVPGDEVLMTIERCSGGPFVQMRAWRARERRPLTAEGEQWWRFADRHHTTFELRHCPPERVVDVLRVVADVEALATVVAITLGAREPTEHVPPRSGVATCLLRLTHRAPHTSASAALDLEVCLDALAVRWHRLDGGHAAGHAASLPAGPRLPTGPPRLSWRSAAPRWWRDRARREQPHRQRSGTPDPVPTAHDVAIAARQGDEAIERPSKHEPFLRVARASARAASSPSGPRAVPVAHRDERLSPSPDEWEGTSAQVSASHPGSPVHGGTDAHEHERDLVRHAQLQRLERAGADLQGAWR